MLAAYIKMQVLELLLTKTCAGKHTANGVLEYGQGFA